MSTNTSRNKQKQSKKGNMRAVTSAEVQEGARDERGESATSDRRPSLVVLQNMLKKIPQNPFPNQPKTLVPAPSDSSGSPADEPRSNQDGLANVTIDSLLRQNGAHQSSPQCVASSNPFYSYRTESGNMYNGGEDVGQKLWQEARVDGLFDPPPGFQNSPLDPQETGKAAVSEAEKDLFQAFSLNHVSDSYLTTPSGSASGQYHSINLNSPENNTKNPFKNLQSKSSSMQDLLRASSDDFSLKTPSGKLLDNHRSVFTDPLQPSSNTDLFGSSKAPFYSASTTESHLFQTNGGNFSYDDKLASSRLSGSDVDVFSPSSDVPSPIVKELFRDGGSTTDLFGAKAANSKDFFRTLPGSGLAKSTSDLSESAVQWKYFDAPRDVVLTTPQGSKHGILQPTPFSQARKLSKSPDSSPTELAHVKLTRRPPKPLPRSRPPRLEKPTMPENSPKPADTVESVLTGPPKPPPKPFKALPKPVIDPAAKPQDDKALNQEDYNIFEDILLIGQEKCVEDWPEDSPQLLPDFKPSGKLRLRRESLKFKMDSEGGGRGEDQDDAGSYVKSKESKFSWMSRGSSKDKLDDDLKDGRSWTLPPAGKDYFYETNTPSAKWQDGEQSWSETKKKPLKNKVNQLLRRASTSLVQRKPASAGKDDDAHKKKMNMKESTIRWRSQEAMFGDGIDEEEVAQAHLDEADAYGSKGKKKIKMKFGSQKGFANFQAEQPQGAHGYTPRRDSKDRRDPFYGAADMWQEHNFEDVDEIKRLHHSSSQDEVPVLHPKQSSFPAEQLDDDEQNAADDYKAKKNKFKGPVPKPRKEKRTHNSSGPGEPMAFDHAARAQTPCADDWLNEDDDDDVFSRRQHGSPIVHYVHKQDELGLHKQKKMKHKPFQKHKTKKKTWEGAAEDVAGEHLSEAAQAEWLAAQKDERAAAGLQDGDGDGDTDSLMEWWNTVEQWDELPSDDEAKHLDESQSFTILADKVNRGLRMFNKVFTERAEVLWQHVVKLKALADHLATFHQKAKAAGITGSTTAAVGGVTAIAGLALAPFTFGASLIVTAVGVGVATAGGITSASATISDNVNNVQERKKVEAVLQEYQSDFRDLAKILHFVNHGLYKLRGHPFLRSGTQHYSEDWEVRKAVQMISLVDLPVLRAMELTDANLELVQRLQSGMDKYFKNSREIKKAFKKEVVARIKEVASVLNDGVVELNSIREELQKAIGNF
ncbi:uncharacterized protein LOC133472809 isoform X2 [Phyllopteryx taeniolatus]|uniref:uncharacterized protein LOC133472809 isoform X2 n=1 Tax=Phyllopteryx taeniolatus TaxID=161469 RepID=UPI002AD40B6C|nr:uncharacterized protein LOC133472809 isoform X2 [Phyllopteryx taeniolatus]